jgi:hypothetical protein
MPSHPKSGHSDEAKQGLRFTGNGERLLYHLRHEDIHEYVTAGCSIPTDASGATS